MTTLSAEDTLEAEITSGTLPMSNTLTLTQDLSVTEMSDLLLDKMKDVTLTISPTGFGAWSHSRLKQLMNCPLQFLLKTVLRSELIFDHQREEQYWKYRGLVAHNILEKMVLNDTSFEEAYASLSEEFIPLMGKERWDDLSFLKENLEAFCYRVHRFGLEHTTVEKKCEQKYAVDKNWRPVSFYSEDAFFRGILDLTLDLQNGNTALFDHKYGGEAKYGIRNYEMQLKSQAILYLANNPDSLGIIPFIHFIQDGEVAGGGHAYYERNRVMEEFTVSIHSCLDGTLENLQTAGKFKHHTGNHCNYCDFQPICRGGKRGTANVLQPVVEASKVFFRGN